MKKNLTLEKLGIPELTFGTLSNSFGGETQAHKALKRLAVEHLSKMGFTDDQIFLEYRISNCNCRRNGDFGYHVGTFVDVAGISPERSVAIECGTFPKYRIKHFSIHFKEVLTYPYSKLNEYLIGDLYNMEA